MFYPNQKKNHVRHLLSLTLAAVLAASLSVHTGYSSTNSTSSVAAHRAWARALTTQMPTLRANGKIAFVSDRDGNGEIYVMDADGSNQTQLTNNPAGDGDVEPAFSPDGAKITFTSHRNGNDNTEIYVMNADGSSQMRLTNNAGHDYRPTWSPDGAKIAYIREGGKINVMYADGSGQTTIYQTAASLLLYSLDWSPDGTRIAFAQDTDDGFSNDVFTISADGSGVKQITSTGFFEFNVNPAWSPDGTRIVFGYQLSNFFGADVFALDVMNADGSNRQELRPGVSDNPDWSPDGTKITFDNLFFQSPATDIYVLNQNGSGLVNLTNSSAKDYDPSWGPVPSAVPSPCANPIDCAEFFVRQHYLDFLNREPDAGGLAYWTDRITQCGSDARCIHERRIGVSAAFFIELEFQDTGYFVYRFYKASFGRQPNYAEFTSDRGKVVDGSSLEANKQAFADEWVQREAFRQAFSNTLSNTEFVNRLFDTAGLTASIYDPQRQQEIAAMNSGRSRALVLRDVIEIPDFKNPPDPNSPRYAEVKQVSQYNPAFVLMQYFGYLRRNVDQTGYDHWLDVLDNRAPNNYPAMVCAFLTSVEYQLRFGASVTRSNQDCGG